MPAPPLLRRSVPVLAVVAVSAFAASIGADAATAVLLLLVCVTGSALLGRVEGLVASVVSAAALSYVFIPPRWRFSLGKREDVLALVTYVFVAATVASLLERLRTVQRNEAEAIRAVSEARAASEIDRSRAAFFAAAGHNLRTPLTCIRTAASTLVRHPDLERGERARLLAALVDETTRLERLVERALQLARIQATAVVAVPETLDLAGVVQTTISRIPVDGAVFELDLAEPGPPLELDPLLVEQVLLNLVENAADFAPAGSPIRLVGRGFGLSGYRLEVIDRGPGVPADQQQAIFCEFHSGRRPDGAGSTGLGLTIAAALASVQGGTITAGPTPGGGATFTWVLRQPM